MNRTILAKQTASALLTMLLAMQPVHANDVDMPFGMRVNHLNLVFSASDAAETEKFYGEIIRLKQIPDIPLPGNRRMIRFKGGDTELKFIVSGLDLPKLAGGTRAARGIRLAAILLPDSEQSGIEQRLKENGHDVPAYTEGKSSAGYGYRYGMVYDHDGNQIEIVFLDDSAPREKFQQVQIGLTVSDSESMSAFMSDILGLSEVAGQSNARIRRYGVGVSQIKFWEAENEIPAHVGGPSDLIGMSLVQFLVPDVDAVRNVVLERGGTIHTEPFALGKMATIMFVEGPDGILFEFAGPMLDRLR
jgi:catechol 2,3-dioxygenase-like lactoylglutathione lyase family enzyme